MTSTDFRYSFDLIPITDNDNESLFSIDLLFTATGSDERACRLLSILNAKSHCPSLIVVFDFKERRRGCTTEELKTLDYYRSLGCEIDVIECSITDIWGCIAKLMAEKSKWESFKKIGIDISCFTKPYFFSLLRMFMTYSEGQNVTALYTEPKSYIFRGGSYLSYRSTIGPLNIIGVPGFPGKEKRNRENLLIVQLGFDGDIARALIDEVAPDHIRFVNGFPGYHPKFKDLSLINNDTVIGRWAGKDSLLYSTANDPYDTFNTIEQIVSKNGDKAISIAPLGTKPMALGACLFALRNKDIRIIYPMPKQYENKAADNCWRSWSYELTMQYLMKTR